MSRTTATTEPVSAALGRTFPTLIATSLSGKVVTLPDDAKGDVSLVVLVFLESALPMAESGSAPFSGAFTQNPRVTTYLVTVVGDSLIGRSLADRIRQGLAGGVPPAKYNLVLTVPGDIERCRRAYDIDETSFAYIYLLDGRGIIRWMEKGTITPEGLDALLDAARAMLEPLLE
ncbi:MULTISPECIES: hypothetical protein [unclassified Methanoculleus]|uniref:hypothetical protein n=1 Tax=unclassified Methanoculleus TaxID=2619537 RepID=UPI0025D688BB|nr:MULTISPECIES: hypothetical protein [unclassified Methanoculleus]MCK9318626.1 mitochondrial ATPase complex subunit ATP10 [Methanoculleus sp.]MDD2254017.1 hypothetical protein [Methanoculleus sp.]MDD2787264.1 hypothetical protein [Methanoculleus sp.]MDD3216865.1 hypothetical protein [Methanoculleus sp.]MDD4314983.1 hypothetical protein [Methanoculleus sp.]